jgi:hypothetical protein
MTTTIDAIRVNGNIFEWGSIRVKIRGAELIGFYEISYGHKRERQAVYGAGKHHAPIGVTRGKYSVENGKLGVWKHAARDLRKYLAQYAPDKKSYGDVEFNIIAEYIDYGQESITEELLRCYIVSENDSHSEGTDPLKEEIGIFITVAKKNGLTLFDNSDRRF